MKHINDAFKAMATGDMSFLSKYPMEVNPQDFGWMKGDKETMNTMIGSMQKTRTNITNVQKHQHIDKDATYVSNKTMTVYADWNYQNNSGGGKERVEPTMHLINYGGHAVKMYYLPWRENRMHTMTIDDQADFFITASMHGCRFTVKDFGNGMLSVGHANVQPGPGIDAQAAVLKMIEKEQTWAPTALSFGKDKYFADAQRMIHATKRGLMPMGIMPEDVRSAHVDTYLANVVGVRDGRKWRFYYQLTAIADVIVRGKTTKPKYFGRFGKKVVDQELPMKIDVVLKVAEIYPEEATIYTL